MLLSNCQSVLGREIVGSKVPQGVVLFDFNLIPLHDNTSRRRASGGGVLLKVGLQINLALLWMGGLKGIVMGGVEGEGVGFLGQEGVTGLCNETK